MHKPRQIYSNQLCHVLFQNRKKNYPVKVTVYAGNVTCLLIELALHLCGKRRRHANVLNSNTRTLRITTVVVELSWKKFLFSLPTEYGNGTSLPSLQQSRPIAQFICWLLATIMCLLTQRGFAQKKKVKSKIKKQAHRLALLTSSHKCDVMLSAHKICNDKVMAKLLLPW
ncbi:hypothetical protein HNY73_002655 [Argiope bruennichi]|uniref:Uncharacterized protein n=1 Tax=Argiope bruennichi TaxID=94029 RepID=A0A8T0FU95_ARGBR|nr:hypothetical protein HNY73_002655 [Argiope bruennichi]